MTQPSEQVSTGTPAPAAGDTTTAPSTDHAAAIELVGIAKRFPAHGGLVTAVDGVDLVMGEGEFFSLLGPSGCGKTTTLRMIGGFEEPTEGQILLYGEDVVGIPPNQRDVNMVFQSYALFPHMSVFDNVAFGLRRKSVAKDEIRTRVNEMLELVELGGKADRRPKALSGGQQQRVALARALVNRPRALLLDEPLAALDAKLRQSMQLELKRIQRDVGITFVFVTHDQSEALTMSDRLVVMNQGRVEQTGAPRDVYEHPRTRFVAGFIGTSNILTGTVQSLERDVAHLDVAGAEQLTVPDATAAGARVHESLDVTVRPEKISISHAQPDPGRCMLHGQVHEVIYVGTSTQYVVRASDDVSMMVFVQNSDSSSDVAAQGDRVWLSWRPEHSLALAASPADAEPATP